MRATGNTTHADGARPRPRKRSIQAAWAVLLLVPTLVVLPLATPALASHGPGVTHDQTAFVSSLDRPTLEDFERFAANEVMTTQIPGLVLSSAANNVTILDNVAASSGTKLLWGGFPASSGQRQQYHLTFTTPVRAVGFNLDDVYPNLATSPQVTIRFSDGSAQVVYSVPDTDSNVRTPIYFGYQRATASVSEVIVESGFESDGVNFEEMGIDDLAFTRTVAGPTPGQRIVFASNRTGVYQIWGVGPDGSDLQQVTTAAGPNTDPHWSPDGHKIVFVSQRNGDPEIYVYNVVTGVETRMTNNPGFDADPAWSPDGTKIAFASSRAGSQSFDIYQISAGGPENVDNPAANLTNNPAWDSFPAYDAAGNVLFQSRDRTGSDFDIFRRRVVGPSVLFDALTSNDINDQGVQGSPVDAQVITYASENGAGGYSLHVKALVDAVDRQVTATTPFYDDTPTFAPDGTALAYTHRDGGGHIRVLPLDGSASLPLATVASDDGSPSWSSTLKLTVSKPDTIASPSQIPATDIPTQNRSAAIESAPLAMTPSLTPLAMTPSLTPLAMTPSLAPLAMTPSLTPLAMTPSLVPLAMTPSLTPLAMHPSLAPLAMTPSLTPAALDTLRRQPFSSLTISSPPGAESLFVGSALAGRALQDFSIYDAVADPVAGPRLAALLYQNVDIARALPAVGLGMLLLGDTRLAAINSSVVPWCSTLEALGYGPGGGCGGPELTATTNGAPDPRQGLSARPIDLAIAGVPFDHADHPIHLHRVRMGDIALASDAPLLDVRVADTQALRASNLGAIPTSALPVDVQANPALIDCAGGYCTPDTSLYEARRDGRLQDGFLFRHLGATVADLLLGEVVFGLAGVNTVPYEDYTSSQLGVLPYQAPGSSSRVTYTLTSKDPTGFGGARAVSMKLPATFTALPGTSSLTVDGVPYAVAPTITPAADGATISWSLTDLGDGSTVSASIDAAPGLLLGHFVASARAVAGSTEQVLTGQAAVNVGEANEPNDTPETAALLAPDTLVFGHTASGIDYYKVNVPPGAVADVILGNRESGDNDLVVYYPAGAAGVSPDDRLITAIANQASSKTYADQGTSPTLLGEPVSGGTLDDVPLLDRPVAGVSDTRFRANERVIFQALPVSSGPSEYLIQVSSYLNQGSFGPYSLRLAIRPAAPTPACSARTGVTSTDWSGSRLSMPSAPLASDRKTLFLVNEDRMRDLYPGNETVGGVSVNRVDALLSNLRELASHPKVNGVIVPLDADPTFRL
ncbi:MAG TPA: hypothetical protein VMY34_01695, partial [Acidimicrobiales bacterium]|nr:hypothetical protein [Acidimicrobiales bacterium]